MGLKLGHDGLSYNWRVDTYQFRNEILLTEFKDILPVLGYSVPRYNRGFDSLEEIFEFAASSRFFNKDIFLLHNRNHASRIRDVKRKTYMEFLDWLETKNDLPVYPKAQDKAEWLPYLLQQIEGFEELWNKVQTEWCDAMDYKRRFNGDLISEWTGLKERPLGEFIKWLKACIIEDEPAFSIDFVLGDNKLVKNRVLNLYNWYKEAKKSVNNC